MCFAGWDGVNEENGTAAAKGSFGAVGQPRNLCSKAPLLWKIPNRKDPKFVFSCQGRTEVSEVFSAGIVSYTGIDDYPGLAMTYASCFYDPNASDAKYMPL